MSTSQITTRIVPERSGVADAPGDDHTTSRQSWWRRHALVLVCLGLFFTFLAAQSVTGWHVYNSGNEDHGQETVTYLTYLTTGHFVEGTLENWESEFLQMAAC
jgi:hypothetical protein